jgi:hypothetical protein
MSIATLKKKTQSQYRNISVGQSQFSINGTHRSQGYIGQTSLSRSLPRTLYNGIYPRGSGGCCGTFPIQNMVQSAVTSLNDPKIIKKSVMNTKGMLEEKLGCTYGVNIPGFNKQFSTKNKNNIVKPDNNNNNNSQQDYIRNKSKNTIQKVNKCTSLNQIKNQSNCPMTNTYFTRVQKPICNFTKPKSDYIPISQGENLINLTNKCINQNETNVTKNKKTPFGCGL